MRPELDREHLEHPLRAVLLHNKDEEIEHAMMTVEWLRRHDSVFDENLKTYLNSTGPITSVEAQATGGGGGGGAKSSGGSPSLGIGSLKGKR